MLYCDTTATYRKFIFARTLKLLRSLNDNGVKYLVIGGLARVLHDADRQQPSDTDVMIACSPQNAECASRAITQAFPFRDEEDLRRVLGRYWKWVPLPSPQSPDVDVLTPPKLESAFDFCRAWARSTETLIPRYNYRGAARVDQGSGEAGRTPRTHGGW